MLTVPTAICLAYAGGQCRQSHHADGVSASLSLRAFFFFKHGSVCPPNWAGQKDQRVKAPEGLSMRNSSLCIKDP